MKLNSNVCPAAFLLYSPLNQGLKHEPDIQTVQTDIKVFTLQSIKSRIETYSRMT